MMGGGSRSGLLLALLSSALLAGAAVLGGEGAGLAGLGNELAYERRENEAIARLYENVLDVLQCRLPHEQRLELAVGREALPEQRPVQDLNWRSPKGLGQVSGVTVDQTGRPVLFHRGDHVWEYDSFDANYQYTKLQDGPIGVNTVLTLNPETGDIEDEWGSNAFYLPHGIHIDPRGNIWLTDVALHQVFKFPKRERAAAGEHRPSLVLGERFAAGSDAGHFCQPTAVAVTPAGEVVVADGYCNERLLIFDAEGRLLGQLPGDEEPADSLRLRVPHSLTILRRGDVCVADREHQRIVCFDVARLLAEQRGRAGEAGRESASPPRPALLVHRPGVCRIFGVASHGDLLYAINGPTTPNNPVMGFTLNPDQGSVIATWGPTFDAFSNPHEIAACPNGTALYVSEIGPNLLWKFRLLTNWKM